MKLPHIPILRSGIPYKSLDTVSIRDHRNSQVLAHLSQANPGLIRRDLIKRTNSSNSLQNLPCTRILEICIKAAEIFSNASLPMGTGDLTQSPEEYVIFLSATSGLPHKLCRRNMEKIHNVLREMPKIINGLTRNLDLEILNRRVINENGLNLCYYPITQALAAVLPSNSPGVNSLWLPAIALKIPVIIKPGSEEPWTPWRIIQALLAAGCPKEMFGFYPTTHDGAEAIIDCCGRSMIFGDQSTLERYTSKPNINVHGPGFSKIVIGEDQIGQWPEFIDLLTESVAANSGRSCINTSTIIVPGYGREIADALAQKLITIYPQALSDQQSKLSAFPNAVTAESIDLAITKSLQNSDIIDVTAQIPEPTTHYSAER